MATVGIKVLTSHLTLLWSSLYEEERSGLSQLLAIPFMLMVVIGLHRSSAVYVL